MASYTNRRGDKVEVDSNHVETAIEIKIELQKESPSGKCSWARHRRMMEEEGFDDSDSNESYRQLVKQEQKKVNKLPSASKYADMVSGKKLESVRNAIGEMFIAKRSAQNTNRELQRAKREIADDFLFIEDVKEAIKAIDVSSWKTEKLKSLPESDNSILVNIADWHIGLKTDEFNYDVANRRAFQYAEEILHYAKKFGATKLYVQNLGDTIEGVYMRTTQAFEVEFDYSTQVVRASEIIFKFLNMLSQECEVVYLGGIFGNHARITSDKAQNLDGDSSENIIDASLKSFIELMGNDRITVEDKKQNNKEMSFEINGRKIKSVHGDGMPKNGNRIDKFISSDEINYDLLLYGHYHHSSMMEHNHGRLEVGTGCLPDSTSYSKGLGYITIPSQTIVVFEGRRILPLRIELD